ncbi:MAG: NADP(H)-dependent aldo-keto reductase [Gammaproteobacteria bacterium]
MKYRQLGRTDVDISLIGLGTMTWGNQNSEVEAHQQLDYAVGEGINFIDTAEMYPVEPSADTFGRTEEYIGNWLKKRGGRDRLIIATKVSGRAAHLSYIRDGNLGLDRKNIESAVNTSLTRLQTDYIDLYQTHWPDRDANRFGRLNYFHAPEKDGTPIEETLGVMGDLVKTGKIRHVGISNETAWGLSEHLRLSEQKGLPRVVSVQNPYNLLNRSFEIGLSEFAQREQVGLLAYSPSAFATLSGKYLNNAKPAGARLTLFSSYKRYSNAQAVHATEEYVTLAEEHGIDPMQMALSFVNSRPFVTSTIIGATNMDQLKTNIASADLELPKELLKEIEKIHTLQPNPGP